MARLQVLTLPGVPGEPSPFALVLDRISLDDIDRLAGEPLEILRSVTRARAVLVFDLDMDADVVPGSAASEHVRRVIEDALGHPVEVAVNNPEASA